jgi:hypothetical protein
MSTTIHPAASDHLPLFITAPGSADILFNVVVVFAVFLLIMVMVLYFRLHALPEHIAHGTDKIQYEVVSVLVLISLFTHNHLYWILGLLLALVRLPDFTTPLTSMADSLAKMIDKDRSPPAAKVEPVAASRRVSGQSHKMAGE